MGRANCALAGPSGPSQLGGAQSAPRGGLGPRASNGPGAPNRLSRGAARAPPRVLREAVGRPESHG
eukprot:14767012-Alexandrium_andersonii.AAC.1